MCGICGKINISNKPIPTELITRMSNSLSHRGPDDTGIYQSTHGMSVALGHQRLSIVDLSTAGKQPMNNEDQSIWLVFNGEIYNHRQLRKTLEHQGHRFSSKTDSEVIIHLYEDEGIKCLEKLNGMFAFCLWDSKKQTIFLCRDRVGIKPLVYAWDGENLSFASEIKSLLNDPDISRAMDDEALNLYLTFNYIPAPYTIYKHIRKLEPGHYLMLSRNQMTIQPYWDLTPKEPFIDLEEGKKQLYAIMEDAVRRELQADVPLGAFLSGGLDSSIIVGLMAKNSTSKVKTFSIGYQDLPLFDETAFAKHVAELHQTEHSMINLQSRDVLNVFTDLLQWFDEPFADSSAIPTFIVSRETRRHVKVALSGDGGDELFAGYRMYAGEYWWQRYQQVPSLLRYGIIEPLGRSLPDSRDQKYLEQVRRFKKFISGKAETFEERFFLWNQIFSRELRDSLLIAKPKDVEAGNKMVRTLLNQFSSDDINRMLYCDLKLSLPNDMLTKVDWMSMKNALEVRVPMLDHRVVEWAFQAPGNFKFNHGQGKYILRETFKDLLPPELLKRPKTGFEVPLSRWLKTDLKFLIDEHLSESKIKKDGIFHYAPVKRMIHDFCSNRRDHSWALWNLIVFQAWYSRASSSK